MTVGASSPGDTGTADSLQLYLSAPLPSWPLSCWHRRRGWSWISAESAKAGSGAVIHKAGALLACMIHHVWPSHCNTWGTS